MAFDVQTFAGELGLSDEDKTALFGLFSKYPQAGDKISSVIDAQVAQSLTPLKADLDKKAGDLDAQFATLESLRTTDSATLDAAQKRVEDAAVAVTLARERIQRMATYFGVPPEQWLSGLPDGSAAPHPPQSGTPPGTPSPVETPMDAPKLLQAAGLQAWNALRSSAEIQDIAQEHQTLFGKPLANSVALLDRLQDKVRRTGNGTLTLRDVWNEEYKVDARREELRQAEITRRESEAYERGKREAADAAALGTSVTQVPPIGGGAQPSPVLAALAKDVPTRIGGVPEAVVAAIADYRQRRLNTQKTA